jgi:hypothetical protein
MGAYMSIPDVVDSKELTSVSMGQSATTFNVMMQPDDTATRLWQMAAEGRMIELVVLTLESGILALDNVYLTDVSMSDAGMAATLNAEAVRQF